MKALVSILIAVGALTACKDSGPRERPLAAHASPSFAAKPPDERPPAAPPLTQPAAELPREEPVGCVGTFSPDRPDAPAIYADCTETSWTATACQIPFGQRFCHRGAWTVVCRRNADCPGAMRCAYEEGVGDVDVAAWTFGYCAMTCTADAACGRKDMYCDRDDGVCRHRVVDEEEEEREREEHEEREPEER